MAIVCKECSLILIQTVEISIPSTPLSHPQGKIRCIGLGWRRIVISTIVLRPPKFEVIDILSRGDFGPDQIRVYEENGYGVVITHSSADIV